MDADSIVAEIMAYCQISSHDARELARLIIARLASADAYETGKQAGIDRCIDVLRGNLLAGYGPDAKAQRDADIAILAQRDFDDTLDDEEFFDCHMMRDGSCGAAGTEYCEFDCPTRKRGRV